MGFRTAQNSDARPLTAQHFWQASEIVFKVAVGICTARGNDGIRIIEGSRHKFHARRDVFIAEGIQRGNCRRNEHLVFRAAFHDGMVTGE